MKRMICLTIIAVVMATMLCACGGETFTCGLCRRQVTQTPHKATVFGQEIKICDACYETVDNYAAMLG